MTVEAMSSLPLQATSALAHAAGRLALHGVQTYMRAPLRNSAVTALLVVSAMAGSNLLYGQAHHHPAPLFGSFEATDAAPAKVQPVAKPKKVVKATSAETTGAIAPIVSKPAGVGNADVKLVQQQLKDMNLFTGTVDGLFGPRTSKAIRAFEEQIGRPQRGQLTPEIVALIKGAQMPATPIAPKPALAPAPAPAPAPAAAATTALTVTEGQPAAVESQPLPAPPPLAVTAASAPEAIAAPEDTTGSTGTEAVAMTTPPTVTKRSVPTIAVRATTAPSADDSTQQMPAALSAEATADDGTDEGPAVADASPMAATDGEDASAPAADAPDATAVAMADAPVSTTADPAMDKKVVTAVQRGLNSLGFLHGEITGEADEATAKAIRNFEVYYNYAVTGRVTQNLVKMLIQAGGVI